MPERKIGHFKIVRHLGQGLVSNFFQAVNEETGNTCGLKILRPQFAANSETADAFISAAEANRAIEHPGIAKIYSAGRIGNTVFIERAFLLATTVRQYVARFGPLDPAFCIHIAALLASMVNFAASRNGNFPHGAISANNVFIRNAGTDSAAPSLTDFSASTAVLSISGGIANIPFPGEAGCLAPEVAAGDAPTPASDVFSIAVLMYEMLCGTAPFRGETNSETLQLLTDANPLPLTTASSSIPHYLENIIFKCLEKNPARRIDTPAQLATELRKPEASGQSAALFVPSPITETPAENPPPEKTTPTQKTALADTGHPFLHLENNLIRLEQGKWKKLVISNPGTATLSGSIERNICVKTKPSKFTVEPDEKIEIQISPSLAPPTEKEFFIVVSSNGGKEKVKLIADQDSRVEIAAWMKAAAVSIACAAGGGRILWGLSNIPNASPAWLFTAALFAICVAGALLTATPWLSLAGSAIILLSAWTLLNFDPAMTVFISAAAACLIPGLICLFVTTPLSRKLPPAIAVILPPLVLTFLVLTGGEIATGGTTFSVIAGPPLAGIQRRTTDNFKTSAFRKTAFEIPSISKPHTEKTTDAKPEPIREMVVIKGKKANIRIGPGTNYRIIMSASAGQEYESVGKAGLWTKLKLPDGEGWVSTSLIEKKN